MPDAFFYVLVAAWFALSIGLLVGLKVFKGATLWNAPARPSSFTPLMAGGVFLLYMGAQMVALETIRAINGEAGGAPAAATAPALVSAAKPSSDVAKMVQASIAMAIAGAGLVVAIGFLVQQMVVGGLKRWLLGPKYWLEGLVWGFLGWLIIYPWLILMSELMSYLLSFFGQKLTMHETLKALHEKASVPNQLILVLTAGIVAPIVEEFVFRGVLQTSLVQRGWGFFRERAIPPAAAEAVPGESLPYAQTIGEIPAWRASAFQRWSAIVISSFFFALIHFMPDQFLVLFVLSLAIGYVYERTGSLLSAISLHAVFNCVTLAFTLWLRD